MEDNTYPDGQKLAAALEEFAEVGIRERKYRLEETLTKKRKFVHIGMYFIAPMLLCSS
jgi:hypothetical protein